MSFFSFLFYTGKLGTTWSNLKISAGDVLYFCGFYEEEEEEDHTQLQQENIMTNRMDDALKNQSIWPAILAPLMFLEPGTLL